MEKLLDFSISGLIVLLISVIYYTTSKRITHIEDTSTQRLSQIENIASAIGTKLDGKVVKEQCESHRAHQTQINIETITRLTRIETKADLILNNKNIKMPNDN